ncbi:MAG TPA: response regulator transcription factor [Cyclobacteriaceae bacterium]|nr:response regulator transcription factor [Cyclobacteriaceae bacterium]HRJ82610.1 response regulator transcription factor [Cyclobacteriaceae bacterium]
MNKLSILVVEDDPNLGFVIQDNLGLQGYDVSLGRDGEEGLRLFHEKKFNLCILDVMMPKKDGFSVARAIREQNRDIPILFLTAKAMTEDKLEGFRTGADDYITKPFSLEELFCRVEVFLKRGQAASEPEKIIMLGSFTFDYSNFRLTTRLSERTLTSREAEVLRLLFLNRNRVLKREEILKAVWGDDDYFLGRSMDVFISKLRKYLKDDPTVQIVNYHGVGFKLEING